MKTNRLHFAFLLLGMLLAAGCTDERDNGGTGNIAPGTPVEINFDAPTAANNGTATRAATTVPLPANATVRITPYNKTKNRYETSLTYYVGTPADGKGKLIPYTSQNADGTFVAGTKMKVIMGDTYQFYISTPAKDITSEGYKQTVGIFCVLPGVSTATITAQLVAILKPDGVNEVRKTVTYSAKFNFPEPLQPGYRYQVRLVAETENAEVLPTVTITDWDMTVGAILGNRYPYITTNPEGKKNVMVFKDVFGDYSNPVFHDPWVQTPQHIAVLAKAPAYAFSGRFEFSELSPEYAYVKDGKFIISQDEYGTTGGTFHPKWGSKDVPLHYKEDTQYNTVSERFEIAATRLSDDVRRPYDEGPCSSYSQASGAAGTWRVPTLAELLLLYDLRAQLSADFWEFDLDSSTRVEGIYNLCWVYSPE